MRTPSSSRTARTARSTRSSARALLCCRMIQVRRRFQRLPWLNALLLFFLVSLSLRSKASFKFGSRGTKRCVLFFHRTGYWSPGPISAPVGRVGDKSKYVKVLLSKIVMRIAMSDAWKFCSLLLRDFCHHESRCGPQMAKQQLLCHHEPMYPQSMIALLRSSSVGQTTSWRPRSWRSRCADLCVPAATF